MVSFANARTRFGNEYMAFPIDSLRYREVLDNDNATGPPVQLIKLFDALYIVGLVFLGLILLTAWRSSKVKRGSTWFLFIFSWFFTSLANLILLGQQTGPIPETGVCLLQAMLVYGTPVFNSTTAVAFMLQVYLFIQGAEQRRMVLPRKQNIAIHAFPWFLLLCVLIEVLTLGLTRPDTIRRDPSGMYCHLSIGTPSKITAGITIIAMIIFLVLGFRVVFLVRRRWKALELYPAMQDQSHISPDVATRVLIFSFCPIIALAVSFLQYLPEHSADPTKLNIVLAVLPLIAGLIFGSQRDILRTWMVIKFSCHSGDENDGEVSPATV